jgi:hypothetical protein
MKVEGTHRHRISMTHIRPWHASDHFVSCQTKISATSFIFSIQLGKLVIDDRTLSHCNDTTDRVSLSELEIKILFWRVQLITRDSETQKHDFDRVWCPVKFHLKNIPWSEIDLIWCCSSLLHRLATWSFCRHRAGYYFGYTQRDSHTTTRISRSYYLEIQTNYSHGTVSTCSWSPYLSWMLWN